jgi:hypothetical protein
MKYYYDIKKAENAKYLLIQCTGYTGSSIEFSFSPMSSIVMYIIIGVILFLCLASAIVYICWNSKKEERLDNKIIEQKTDLAPINPTDNQPAYSNY